MKERDSTLLIYDDNSPGIFYHQPNCILTLLSNQKMQGRFQSRQSSQLKSHRVVKQTIATLPCNDEWNWFIIKVHKGPLEYRADLSSAMLYTTIRLPKNSPLFLRTVLKVLCYQNIYAEKHGQNLHVHIFIGEWRPYLC